MTKYYFKTNQFGLTDKGIHLLRNGFNYETIEFSQIKKAEIRKANELNNWIVILIIGLVLLTPGVYMAVRIIDAILNGDVSTRSARMVLFLFIPLIGGYFIYTSLQTGTVLEINYGRNKKSKFSLRKISDNREIEDFKSLMKNRLNSKLRVK